MELTERELSEMIVGSRANPMRAMREIGMGLRRAIDVLKHSDEE
jgi:hypothetical protein